MTRLLQRADVGWLSTGLGAILMILSARVVGRGPLLLAEVALLGLGAAFAMIAWLVNRRFALAGLVGCLALAGIIGVSIVAPTFGNIVGGGGSEGVMLTRIAITAGLIFSAVAVKYLDRAGDGRFEALFPFAFAAYELGFAAGVAGVLGFYIATVAPIG